MIATSILAQMRRLIAAMYSTFSVDYNRALDHVIRTVFDGEIVLFINFRPKIDPNNGFARIFNRENR